MSRIFDTPLKTNDQSLDRVLAAGLPLLLLFVDGPVPAALEQALERLARAHAGELLIAQVAARDNPQSVRRFNLSAFPALLTLRGGQEASRALHILPADLEAHSAYLLGTGPRPPERQPAAGAPGASSQAGPGGAAAHPLHTSDASFERDVLRSPLPVLVDFWAPWCGPCRMVEPSLEKLAGELSGRLRIVKLNVDENPATAGRYGAQSIPTMLIVKDGKIVDRWSGALPEHMLRMRLRPHVGS